MDEQEQADRREAAQAVERALSVLFGRARSFSLQVAAAVHPGLDTASYALLVHLYETGPVRAAEIVERTGLDKSTVSRQIARLEELGLLERAVDSADGRARIVQLTDTGHDRLAAVRADRRKLLRERLDQWSTVDIQTFSTLLERLNEVL
ncbi:MarR family winged helix-turn-helix transcriptional regulator [Kutzneria buriramensis]|uniref:DNA-binding MarR family transcriptional regulator n=1 Tax=Kutzneria buriramensis TaxID=1045776 RepID=A0A3E0I8L8_9PSEU|nr:MarR family transcriptional regulator [Kutzneria buriramensis]REH55010.1 DNA-binding MarR family transcriptional regulator [Kutzneria buriramensis]